MMKNENSPLNADGNLHISFFNKNAEYILVPISAFTENGLFFLIESDKFDFRKGEKLKNFNIITNEFNKYIEEAEIVYCSIVTENINVDAYKVGIVFSSNIFDFRAREHRIRVAERNINLAFDKNKKHYANSNILQDVSKYGFSVLIKAFDFEFSKDEVLENIVLTCGENTINFGKGIIVNLEFFYDFWLLRISILNKEIDTNEILELNKDIFDEKKSIAEKIHSDYNAKNFINKKFKENVINLRFFLDAIKYNLDSLEDKHKLYSSFDSNDLLENISRETYSKIDDFIKHLYEISKNFNETEFNLHQKYFRQNLSDLILHAPINKLIYYKPKGVALDNLAHNYAYNSKFYGNTLFSKFMHAYTTRVPFFKNYRNSSKYLSENLEKIIRLKLKKNLFLKFAIFTAGFCFEIFDLLESENIMEHCEITLYFISKHNMKDSEKILKDFKKKHKYININFEYIPLYKLISDDFSIDKQNIIYSFFVPEYLSNIFYLSKFLKNIFYNLNEKGTLFFGKYIKSDEFQLYLKMGLNSKFQYAYLDEKNLATIFKKDFDNIEFESHSVENLKFFTLTKK